MLQHPYQSVGQQLQRRARPGGLIKRRPLLTSLVLLGGATMLCITSLFADHLFPLLTLVGTSPLYLCLSLACVLGVAGVLVGIIGILERVDRQHIPALSDCKEQSYANRN